jgi:hypothetical protein
MHKLEIPQKNIVREFPSEISEMSQSEFILFIDLVLRYLSGTISIDEVKIQLIKKLLNIRYDFRYMLYSEEEREHAQAEIFRLSELCESFFEEITRDGKQVKTFKLSFTKNFIPRICNRYYGPQDALQDLNFAEYRMAHSYYTAYIESKNEDDLNHLIAVLYRPRKRFFRLKRLLPSYDGQHRVPLTAKSNPLFLEQRAADIADLPMAIRYGIFLFFSGCEEFLAKGSVTVDGKEIDFSILYEKSGDSGSDSPDIGLVGILYSLAETKVFGSIEETDGTGLYDIMIRLYQVVKQQKAMEEKYKHNGID